MHLHHFLKLTSHAYDEADRISADGVLFEVSHYISMMERIGRYFQV